MTKSVPSHANPRMLKWAREKMGYSIEQLAELEHIPESEIIAWEDGISTPSIAKLRSLAKRLRRPTAIFYLEELPTEFNVKRLNDYRTLASTERGHLSPSLIDAIRRVREKQSWAREYLEEQGADPLTIVGSIKVSKSVDKSAALIRDYLSIDYEEVFSRADSGAKLKYWRDRVETAGIFVDLAERVDVEEMRGFAISDAYAPFICVNSADANSAKLFSLIHELVHITLGESAISDGTQSVSFDSEFKTEQFCNQVAAEVLVPRQILASILPSGWSRSEEQTISDAARRFGISRVVLAIRLVEIGERNDAWLAREYSKLASYSDKKPSTEEFRIPRTTIVLSRNGIRFAKLAYAAYSHGDLHGGELSSLLKMKTKHFPKLEKALYPHLVSAGDVER